MKHGPHAMLFLVLPGLLCGQVKHTPTLDEMLSLKTISVPKIFSGWPLCGLPIARDELEG